MRVENERGGRSRRPTDRGGDVDILSADVAEKVEDGFGLCRDDAGEERPEGKPDGEEEPAYTHTHTHTHTHM